MQVLAGMGLTGPSLNPAVTFAWAVNHRQHALLEHLLVFWVAPICGGEALYCSDLIRMQALRCAACSEVQEVDEVIEVSSRQLPSG